MTSDERYKELLKRIYLQRKKDKSLDEIRKARILEKISKMKLNKIRTDNDLLIENVLKRMSVKQVIEKIGLEKIIDEIGLEKIETVLRAQKIKKLKKKL